MLRHQQTTSATVDVLDGRHKSCKPPCSIPLSSELWGGLFPYSTRPQATRRVCATLRGPNAAASDESSARTWIGARRSAPSASAFGPNEDSPIRLARGAPWHRCKAVATSSIQPAQCGCQVPPDSSNARANPWRSDGTASGRSMRPRHRPAGNAGWIRRWHLASPSAENDRGTLWTY